MAWFVTQKVASFKPVAVLLEVFFLSAMVKTILYPGGVKALSEIECLEARTVQEHFVDQCAVIWYVQYSGKFSSLPKSLKEELGADIFNMIDASRVYTMDRSEVVMHVHFATKDACTLAVQKMRKVISTYTPSSKMFSMYTSSNRYSIYTLKLPLDSPSNAMEEINKALTSTERDIIDVVLGEDKVLKKYNGTASVVLLGQGNINITLYGSLITLEPVEPKTKGYLYCEHCRVLNDHEVDECPHQPEEDHQGKTEDQKEETGNIDNTSSSNDNAQDTTNK